MGKFCGQCGNLIAPGEVFCGRCGQKVTDTTNVPPQQPSGAANPYPQQPAGTTGTTGAYSQQPTGTPPGAFPQPPPPAAGYPPPAAGPAGSYSPPSGTPPGAYPQQPTGIPRVAYPQQPTGAPPSAYPQPPAGTSPGAYPRQQPPPPAGYPPRTNPAPTRRSPLILILLIVAVLLMAGGGAYLAYTKLIAGPANNSVTTKTGTLKPGTSQTTAATGGKPSTSTATATTRTTTSSSLNSETTSSSTSASTTQQTSAALDWTNPEYYLPAINQKYSYFVYYADGTEGVENVLVGHLDGRPIQTTSVLIPESEAYSEHVVRRADGLYSVSDSDPGSRGFKFLPDKIGKGVTWETDAATFQIVEVDVTRQTSLKTFNHCIVIRQEYAEAGYVFRVWYAPGYGTVQSVYSDTGSLYQELTDVTSMKASDINKLLKKYAPNISKIK